ncbi:cobalamin biosynthesis protein [Oleisolibacter albus]|uniref:cobalamin biosynthesis protein n=1 Tax=Oleisolibacter albus TaxID=2171757 RepID=UPI000DF2918F|nr:cobalamin biosynthesis protein [Oleisolibacter albus]
MLLPLPGGAEIALLLIVALVLDAAIGDLRWLDRLLPGPTALAARLTVELDRRLNRIDRSDGVRQARGTLVLLALILGAGAGGLALTILARDLPAGGLLELLLLTRCLTVRMPWTGMGRVQEALDSGGLEAGRAAVLPLTDRQGWSLDLHGVVRAALEGAAASFSRSLVAPAFWYLLLGLPGVLVWAAVAGCATVIGHDTPRHARFGRAARRAVQLLGTPPAVLSALLLALAAPFVPKGHAWLALRTAVTAAPGHPRGDTAWPLAALAGGLNLSLSGPRREGELVVSEPWLGRGRARALPGDLRPARSLYVVAVLLTAALAAGAGLLRLALLPA